MKDDKQRPIRERRQFTRVPCDAPARIVHDGRELSTRVTDASLKGVSLSRPDGMVPEVGARLDLRILLDPSTSLALIGTVRYVSDERIGLQWERIPIASLRYLRRLVELNGSDAPLETEIERLA